jgi:NitT/TauT family transport system permease protein
MKRLLNIRPGTGGRLVLGTAPVLLALAAYFIASQAQHDANPAEKILPTFQAMARQVGVMALQVDPQTGTIPLWQDTGASLLRLGTGLAIATASSLLLGLALGLLPILRGTFGPFVAAVSVIPPIAILPVLFITFGLGETAKVLLIVLGVAPVMIRDLAGFTAALPSEQIIKAQTLGASTWQVALRVALPQVMPRLIESLRLSLGPAFVFLISAEAIASDVGLGYRVFLVRRYLAMDIILPYVAWIALLAVLFDVVLSRISRRVYPWAHPVAGR